MDLGPICLMSYSASWYLEDSVNGSSKTVQSKFSTNLPLKVPKTKKIKHEKKKSRIKEICCFSINYFLSEISFRIWNIEFLIL